MATYNLTFCIIILLFVISHKRLALILKRNPDIFPKILMPKGHYSLIYKESHDLDLDRTECIAQIIVNIKLL